MPTPSEMRVLCAACRAANCRRRRGAVGPGRSRRFWLACPGNCSPDARLMAYLVP
jgi:hypothetical protein